VFDDLVQLDNPQRDRLRGHGLGLGIVRRLCRLLGIRLRVDSTAGQGARFHLYLPSTAAAAAVVGAQAAAEPRLGARRVVVLDDDASVRAAYLHALRTLDCDVIGAASLDEALSALPLFDAEIALVDFRLAGPEDGIAAVARLRALRPGLQAVIVSADTSALLRQRAAEQGLTMLRKPVTDTLLAQTINRILASQAATEADADSLMRSA
jgi:CheY-like chemotaxis protein